MLHFFKQIFSMAFLFTSTQLMNETKNHTSIRLTNNKLVKQLMISEWQPIIYYIAFSLMCDEKAVLCVSVEKRNKKNSKNSLVCQKQIYNIEII